MLKSRTDQDSLFDLLAESDPPDSDPAPDPAPDPVCGCGATLPPGLDKCPACLAADIRDRRIRDLPKPLGKFGHPVMCDGCLGRRVCDTYTVRDIPLYLCDDCAKVPDPVHNAPMSDD